jgi:phage terminase Nu1 subunit (DNA packaging protein)
MESRRIHESELADLLGVTANRIRTITQDGVIKRVAPATYDLREAVRAYSIHMRELASRANKVGMALNDDLKAAKLEIAKQQAVALKVKNAAARKELVPAREVEREWAAVLRDLRAALLALPSRIGARLPHLSKHDLAQIDAELRTTLEALADGD